MISHLLINIYQLEPIALLYRQGMVVKYAIALVQSAHNRTSDVTRLGSSLAVRLKQITLAPWSTTVIVHSSFGTLVVAFAGVPGQFVVLKIITDRGKHSPQQLSSFSNNASVGSWKEGVAWPLIDH